MTSLLKKKTKEKTEIVNILFYFVLLIFYHWTRHSFFSLTIYSSTQVSLFCLFIYSFHVYTTCICVNNAIQEKTRENKKYVDYEGKKNKDERCLEIRMNESNGESKNNRDRWAKKFHYFALNRDRRIGREETPLKNLSSI